MNDLDLTLARAARYLLAQNLRDSATKLLSCELTKSPVVEYVSGIGYVITVSIRGTREIYELLWNLGNVEIGASRRPAAPYAAAFKYAAGNAGTKVQYARIEPSYGAVTRDAASQTELYMYVFGEDPIGQQVQVLDVGPHSAPTRQLIVSPVPVLPVTDLVRNDKLCFVMMPFAALFRPVYDEAITPAIKAAGLNCRRADDISQPGAILTQIWQTMLQARLVVADLSGGNGNVLYELGLAHVLGHEAILLTQDINNVPFDLRHQRTIVYSLQGDGLATLRTSLTAAIQSSLAVKR